MSYPSKFVEFFGPSTWKTLHSIAWNYAAKPDAPTEEEKKNIVDFLVLLEHLLPCPSCRTHYGAYMLKNPIDSSSRDALTRWLYELHADVNRRSKKSSISYEQHKKDYAGWDETSIARYQRMSRPQQLLELADPHFGRIKKESLLGSLALDDKQSIGFVGVAAMVAVVGAVLAKKYMKQREEKV